MCGSPCVQRDEQGLQEGNSHGVYSCGRAAPRPLSVSALASGPVESWAVSKGCSEDFPGLEVARQ